MTDLSQYRPCVGVAVFNNKGEVWIGKRRGEKGPHSWQMPQGGIDKGEAPEHAAIRELFEETGITYKMITPIGEIDDWLTYDFPEDYRKSKSQNWRGQKQRWYAFRFHGNTKKIDLKAHGPQEFSKWKWGSLAETPNLIIPFKRNVYEQIAKEFSRFTEPVKLSKAKHG